MTDMTLWGLLLTSWIVGFSGAVTPGPLLVACITQSVRGGFRSGLLTTTGHAVMELLVVVSLSLGLGAVLAQPAVASAVGLAGGTVLVGMGLATARGALKGEASLPVPDEVPPAAPSAGGREAARSSPGSAARRGTGVSGPIVTGVVATVTGPYWVLWWATVGLSYLTLAAPHGTAGAAAFYIGHIGADYVWYGVVAAAVAGGRRLLSERGYRWLLAACGVCLVALGVYFGGVSASALMRG
ncbi:MAG TPA: lysine transporter LysE [Clostridiales bacterium]|mgnify:CR=1 FL=1|nr:lysine transporter LysE [Clostridiales bacterium]